MCCDQRAGCLDHARQRDEEREVAATDRRGERVAAGPVGAETGLAVHGAGDVDEDVGARTWRWWLGRLPLIEIARRYYLLVSQHHIADRFTAIHAAKRPSARPW